MYETYSRTRLIETAQDLKIKILDLKQAVKDEHRITTQFSKEIEKLRKDKNELCYKVDKWQTEASSYASKNLVLLVLLAISLLTLFGITLFNFFIA
jgi:hypothetical protein